MPERKLSIRLIRKGALIEETYNAFREWDLSKSIRDNLQTIREGNLIGAKSDGWLKEVLATISSRSLFASNEAGTGRKIHHPDLPGRVHVDRPGGGGHFPIRAGRAGTGRWVGKDGG